MRRLLAVGAATAALLAVGSIAYASIPGPDGVIHGCYKTSAPAQGALITIDSAASCPSGYTALDWSQTGPQGPAGPAATSSVVTMTAHYAGQAGYFTANATVDCPAGTHAINGGIQQTLADSPDPGATFSGTGSAVESVATENADLSTRLNYTLPRPVNNGASWRLQATILSPTEENPSHSYLGITVTYYAVCE